MREFHRGSKLRTSCSSTLRLLGFVLVAAGRTLSLGAQEAAARPLPAENVPEQGHPLLDVIREEAHRYVSDTFHILGSPLRWSGSEWERAGVVLAGIGVLLREDERIDAAFQRNRSRSTDSFSSAVTPFGSYAAVGISAGALGGGLLLRNTPLRETGRDAIEAELIAAGIVTPLLKSVVGRLRPAQGSDADEFHVFSRNQSFPSGHSTEAFAVASVFAARSSGWLVPAVSYALASGVALARMNDRAHFASDVVSGAIVGTLVGRSVVARHGPAEPSRLTLIPVSSAHGGFGIGARLLIGAKDDAALR